MLHEYKDIPIANISNKLAWKFASNTIDSNLMMKQVDLKRKIY